MKQEKTAILIFAQSAQKEAADKPFKNAKQIFTQLNKHTLSIVKKSKLPYFRITEEGQTGVSFGERLTNAIQSVYDKGYDNVIAIGNDTPHIQVHHILDTAKKLATHSLILGPSKDGGFYLIGLHKSQFEPTQFLQLPWQTNTLVKELLHRYTLIEDQTQAHLLTTLEDIDVVIDINTIIVGLHTIGNRKLRQLLEASISTIHIITTKTSVFIDTFSKNRYYNKGSPRLALA